MLTARNKKIKLAERTYLSVLVALFMFIIFTPYIIHSGFTLLEEELAEAFTITLLFIAGYSVLLLYRKEVAKNLNELNRLKQDKGALENRLTEAFRYIGTVNVQIQEIKSVFSDIHKFPENKKDFRYILRFLADRILSMVNAEWALFRIIDTQNLQTQGEYSGTRGNAVLAKNKISNRDLASNEGFEGFTVVRSGQGNFKINTFCIIPIEKISRDQEIFIKAIVNQLEMLFIVFTSIYYKESHARNSSLSKRLEFSNFYS